MGFLKRLLSGVLLDLAKDLLNRVINWFEQKKVQKKKAENIETQRQEVKDAVDDIKKTQADGQEPTIEQVERLKNANRNLSSSVFD